EELQVRVASCVGVIPASSISQRSQAWTMLYHQCAGAGRVRPTSNGIKSDHPAVRHMLRSLGNDRLKVISAGISASVQPLLLSHALAFRFTSASLLHEPIAPAAINALMAAMILSRCVAAGMGLPRMCSPSVTWVVSVISITSPCDAD